MNKRNKLALKFLSLALALPALLSCSDEESLSEFIALGNSPEKPLVTEVNSSYVDAQGDVQPVAGPWIRTRFIITNNHPTLTLYVDALEVSFSTGSGAAASSSYPVSLAQWACADGDPRIIYATIAPGQTFEGDFNCDTVDDGIADREIWYFGSLPASETFVYNGTIELFGYFGDPGDLVEPIKARARKTSFFITR